MTGPGREDRCPAGKKPGSDPEGIGGLGCDLQEDSARATRRGDSHLPQSALAAISRGDGDGNRWPECCPFVIAKQAFFHLLMGDPTNPRDTLFLFVFPCQVSRLTDLPRVINFPLDTLGNETFVPRVERQRGRSEVQEGSGAAQTWTTVPCTPLLGGQGRGQAGWGAGFAGFGRSGRECTQPRG